MLQNYVEDTYLKEQMTMQCMIIHVYSYIHLCTYKYSGICTICLGAGRPKAVSLPRCELRWLHATASSLLLPMPTMNSATEEKGAESSKKRGSAGVFQLIRSVFNGKRIARELHQAKQWRASTSMVVLFRTTCHTRVSSFLV